MPFFVAAAGLGVLIVFALAKPRAAPPNPGGSSSTPGTGGAAPRFAVASTDVNRAAPAAAPPPPKDLLGAVGYFAGEVGGASAFSNDAKAAAVPIGLGVAGAAALIAAATGASISAVWTAPIALVTIAIITIVDGVSRTVEKDKWAVGCQAIATARASGDIQGAQVLYRELLKVVSETSRQWPQPPGSAFAGVLGPLGNVPGYPKWNPDDELGRPYPGFPGLPAPATRAELLRWPSLMPQTMTTLEGLPGEKGSALFGLPIGTFDMEAVQAAFEKDVTDVRAWGLANGIPGEVVGPGDPTKAATDPARYATVRTVKSGPRSLYKWSELRARLDALSQLRGSIADVVPWLSRDAFEARGFYSPEEQAVFEATNMAEASTSPAKKVAAVKRAVPGLTTAQATVVAQQEAAAAAGDVAAGHAARAAGTSSSSGNAADAADGTSRSSGPRNNSGSGGRNG